ncbi:uncharacterized protein DUF4349 [Isoptericola sp. CG 20/1183]|uniref:Uncharacterized protein DUF4349 n=1 Tax=Isoptericola halotolerans TaxID=300560 RepID=A0ABX5EIR1_9MICO|nr:MULTISPECIES: DUF4349 domain-containing protein [Isoptericola]PRZ07664.1 uncharacterized protein DUF4349 [Isoptericola halotolerans]PRZ07977.1 uncharacterized protein DUF4349 [Isoptericola sp. CG 20/1183]
MPIRSLPRRAAAAAVAAVLTLGLAGCSGSGADSAGEADAGVSAAEDAAGEAAAVADETAATDGEASTVVDREVVVTGHVTLVSENPSTTSAELVRLVEQAGGHVEERHESPGEEGSSGWAELTVRVPADRTSSAVDALRDLGTVQDIEMSSADVTSQGQDLDARISALTTSTDRLSELLASAGSTEDLLEVERELSQRQAELDSLAAQRDALSDQVAMSTLYVRIDAPAAQLTAPRGGFTGGLATGWNTLVASVETIVLVLGFLLPWLVVAAVVFTGYRLVRRRRRTDAPPSGPAGGTGGPGSGPDGDTDGPTSESRREPQLTR